MPDCCVGELIEWWQNYLIFVLFYIFVYGVFTPGLGILYTCYFQSMDGLPFLN